MIHDHERCSFPHCRECVYLAYDLEKEDPYCNCEKSDCYGFWVFDDDDLDGVDLNE